MSLDNSIYKSVSLCFVATAAVALFTWLSHAAEFDTHNVTVIWPAGALCLWMVIRFGAWAVIPCVLGQEIFHLLAFEYHLNYFLISAGNGVAAVAGGLLYLKMGGDPTGLTRMRSVSLFIFVAVVVQSVVSAVIGNLVLYFGWGLDFATLQQTFVRWLFADFTGGVLCGPALLLMGARKRWRVTRGWLQALVMVVASLFVVWVISQSSITATLRQYPTILLTMPVCLWLALRQDSLLAATGLMVLIIGCLVITLSSMPELNDRVLVVVQLYGAVIMTSGLVLHSMMLTRDAAIRALGKQKFELEKIVEQRTQQLVHKVEEAEKLAERLRHQSLTDYLTGLPNRRAFIQFTERALKVMSRHPRPLAVLLFDIDHFKSVNDHYGHGIGDHCLASVAKHLMPLVREDVDILSRLGGEEFAVALTETDSVGAEVFAERIRRSIEELSIDAGDNNVKVTVSVGVAIAEADEQDHTVGDLLLMADKAMYQAKNNGRNRVEFFAPEVPAAVS